MLATAENCKAGSDVSVIWFRSRMTQSPCLLFFAVQRLASSLNVQQNQGNHLNDKLSRLAKPPASFPRSLYVGRDCGCRTSWQGNVFLLSPVRN